MKYETWTISSASGEASQKVDSFRISDVNHVGVPVHDISRALAFWEGTLGIRRATVQSLPNVPRRDPPGWSLLKDKVCWVEIEDFQFHLFENLERGAQAVRGHINQPYHPAERTLVFELEGSLERAQKWLSTRSIPWTRQSIDFDAERTALIFQDADGNWMALVEPESIADEKPIQLRHFLGFVHPVTDLAEADRDFVQRLGLATLSRRPGDPRRPGVGLGRERKLIFAHDPRRAEQYNSMDGCPPREFHINCLGCTADRAMGLLRQNDDTPLFEASVRFEEGGGAQQVFTRARSARMLIEISERVPAAEAEYGFDRSYTTSKPQEF